MDKEQIIINGVNVSGCEDYRPKDRFTCYPYICNCHQKPDCYYKQLARKTRECEQIKEKYEALKLENQEGYEIVAELKHEYEGLKKQLETAEEWRIKAESLNEKLELRNTCYRKALEEIEGLVKNFCKDCDDYEDCNWEKEGCYYSLIPNLKDIINKAKGEGC